jgi:hypothetical protein
VSKLPLLKVVSQEKDHMATFWVSFATEEKFLGVAIVDFDDSTYDREDPNDRQELVAAVIRKTIELGCNPGDGSVQSQKIPGDKIPDSFRNRLLGQDEVDHLNAGGFLH